MPVWKRRGAERWTHGPSLLSCVGPAGLCGDLRLRGDLGLRAASRSALANIPSSSEASLSVELQRGDPLPLGHLRGRAHRTQQVAGPPAPSPGTIPSLPIPPPAADSRQPWEQMPPGPCPESLCRWPAPPPAAGMLWLTASCATFWTE